MTERSSKRLGAPGILALGTLGAAAVLTPFAPALYGSVLWELAAVVLVVWIGFSLVMFVVQRMALRS
jgi:hypothetical protein